MNIKEIKSSQVVSTSLDDLIVCNSGIAITLQLSSATGSGNLCYVKNIGSANVTISCSDSATIDGATTQTLVQYASIMILDYGVNVWITL
jgi:hypothetical protein